jgi:rhodanese-related sulfurtransferase
MPYIASITHSSSHADYYPNAGSIAIKIICSPGDGKILGAQAVGYEGVDKRIDVITAFMMNGKTVYDLEMMENCYAPPYSSAKDPVNIAGFAAGNILKGKVKNVQWYDIARRDPSNSILLDVRTEEEFRRGSIKGAINIPVNELRVRLGELPENKNIITFCRAGLRGYTAARILTQNGFENVSNLSGGYTTYESAAGLSERQPCPP